MIFVVTKNSFLSTPDFLIASPTSFLQIHEEVIHVGRYGGEERSVQHRACRCLKSTYSLS